MEIEQLQNQIVSALEIKTDMGKEAVQVFLECMSLLDKKQQDYGSSNIAPSKDVDFNLLGVSFRTNDKVQRAFNLITTKMREGGEPNNESLEDTFKDTVNYGVISTLVHRGVWK